MRAQKTTVSKTKIKHVLIFKEIIFPVLLSVFIGLSIGTGLFPIYEQPKNLKIQAILGFIGFSLLGIFFYTVC